ncbi:ATP-binding protein [Leptothermofonsia sp. ETS-13]|uniref:ATP-binding protein n=1 Tax=Leptothermofonsia sp. ETS-13 TaxID=3035696 RepID=UPI003B9FAB5E
MAKPRQSSFRRVLFTRILLLSIPVLIAGEYVAYRKARSGLLETARQNLTESAVRKGETIRDLTEALRSNLVTASEALSNQLDQPQETQEFVHRMARWLPKGVQCVQLTNMQTGQLEASTCGQQFITQGLDSLWPNQNQVILDPQSSVRISPVNPETLAKLATPLRQLDLVLNAPLYDSFGQLRYALSAQVALHRQEISQPGSLSGYTVILDQDGTILAHPREDRIGRSINQEEDGPVLQQILTNAIAGEQNFEHLFSFEPNGEEWLVGYSPVQIPMSAKEKRTWIVLSVAPLNNALYSLEEVKQVLVILTLGLVAANLLATIYISRDLARPLEKLGDYALHIYQRHPSDLAPKNFKIRELNQLATALDSMVQRLEDRAEELETAWQEAQAANQLKSEFLATTSHELRTPLNAIIGCLRLVKDGSCDSRDEELEFLQRADDASIHLLKIIDDLLNIAKIEAGKMELNLQPVSIQALCEQCLKMVQPGAEKKHLSLSMEIDPHLDQVPLDERRVRQMVINLLSNAVKFTPEKGHVQLKGRIDYGYRLEQDMRPDHSPVTPSTPYLCLEVNDSGIGIPKERWHLLFRPFQQVDSSLTRKHEGTGLGLALTKRLAELHGGTISFQSIPGKGSTFRIWLPVGRN